MTQGTRHGRSSGPRWDGSCISFDIEIEGQLVSCALSRGALHEVSGRHHIAQADLLRYFQQSRARIEEIAISIFAVRSAGVTGTLHIWADDVEDLPTDAIDTQPAEQHAG